MSKKPDLMKIDIPDIVTDPKSKRRYKKGKFLGRGGFAKCFELTDMTSNITYAGKVIAKAQLQKSEQKEKMSQEITIHQSIDHRHVVKFYSYFEDKDYIYIILEICNKRSLMEMHKRRKTVTEPELRYFVRQIAYACQFLHSQKIVHRDLKLGNLFLNDSMELKVGDFGLATRFEGKRKMTLCGTPNYIAPEVLTKKGHSYEVDVWSLGCIVFTLLVGRPPFETSDLKETYRKIRHNDYEIPGFVSMPAKVFIDKMLQAEPSKRPTMEQILLDPYITDNYVPSRLPTSCLTTSPRFDQGRLSLMPTEFIPSPRRALCAIENGVSPMKAGNNKPLAALAKGREIVKSSPAKPDANIRPDYNLNELDAQLKSVITKCPNQRRDVVNEVAQDPASLPIFWISKWVDYTDKYGLGYQLCDNSIGVLFNDMTRMVLMADEKHVQYVEKTGEEVFIDVSDQTEPLKKKVTLLRYYKNYMNEHLQKTGEKAKECDDIARLPYLAGWFRTKNAIVFQLTNGTVQINFFEDHIKLILCPLMEAVTYVSQSRDFYTYKFNLLEQHGCSRDLFLRLKYAAEILGRLKSNGQQNQLRLGLRK